MNFYVWVRRENTILVKYNKVEENNWQEKNRYWIAKHKKKEVKPQKKNPATSQSIGHLYTA